MASLHIQILASKGTVTSFEVVALAESMTIGKALASWPMRPTTMVVGLGGRRLFFAAVDEFDLLLLDYQHDAVGVLCDGVDLLGFRIFRCHRIDENVEVLVGRIGLVHGSKACLPAIALLGVCQLAFGMFTFTFCELESSRLLSRRAIRFGMREARTGNCGSKQCCLLSPALSPQFRKHSGEKLRMTSQTPHTIPGKGHLAQDEKRGGHPPRPLSISPSLISQIT